MGPTETQKMSPTPRPGLNEASAADRDDIFAEADRKAWESMTEQQRAIADNLFAQANFAS